ncbi:MULTISPECIES: type III secretion system effector XopAI [Xanthomonas]|uniref:NAD(+)--protein-arginine ADP-ribosyltransferase n=1 Tax=Xanthomonas axonopodis pv. clitoriae TaxID=487828 RepID=A0AB73MHN8_9XANT|nr:MULTISPECIES: type III secretion system effector XopAI [Xanthomonas]OOW91970.1 type III secretion system effector protein [Xanthomonas campestris pv. vitiscarnosae]OOW93081.1 type III secretion system effector protein [Xanthomonas campestris pv. vitistrifoliae]OOW69513.1 type III secretion system effector protein [Xanthomonas axonopodis pv. martyniicola]OOW76718.1 type III secretion system effector protein [Xanthomonas axonopodis pv. clitoriae]PNV30172.1 type III secretion system effector p
MGLCSSKPSVVGSPVAGSPEHYLTHTAEQTTPSTPSSPEAPMSPSLHGLVALGSPRASSSPRPLSPLVELNTSDLIKQKKQLWQRVQHDGAQFRSTPEERKQFKTALITLWGEQYRPERQQRWNGMMQRMAQMKWNHPELKYMATEDLVALQAWTTDDYEVVQDVLEKEARPTAHGLAFAKCIISALHSLPEEYSYQGTVFTGEDQLPDWVSERYQERSITTDRRFFAASETKNASWQGMAVEWESNSTTGKRISMFSERPNEQEVLFPPGTRFQVTRIEENETHPRLKIYQSQIA